MNSIVVSDVEVTWDPDSRLMSWCCLKDEVQGKPDAAVSIADAMEKWLGDSEEPWGVLFDCKGLSSVDAQWRKTHWRYFRDSKARVYAAWYRPNPLISAIGFMFTVAVKRAGGNFEGCGFKTEEEARLWLRKNGIRA